MALPFFNSKTKEYQEKSLKNQTQLSSKIKSGFNNIGDKLDNQTQILGRVENWLDETYELHREFYQSEDEARRERMRQLRRQKLAGASVGATTGGNGQSDGGSGVGSFIAKTVAGAVAGAFGLKQISKFFKSTPKATGAIDDLTKKTKNLSKAQVESNKALKEEIKERRANNKSSKETRNRLKVQADAETKIRDEKIRSGKTGKVTGSLADDAVKAGKVADTALDASKASKIFARIFPPLAIAESLAVNIKDGYDLFSAGLDNKIETELQGEDIGGVIGGAIGGAIGLIGGPMGAVLGASLGNMVGGWVGDYFDPNFDKEFIQSSENLIARKEGLAANLAALEADKGNMSEREYKLEHDKLMREKQFLDSATIEQATIQKLFEQRQSAADEYNEIARQVKAIEDSGGTAGESLLRSLKAAENSFNEADDRFDAQAKEFEKQLNEKLALKSAIDKGIYDHDYIGASEIDASRLGELSQAELRGILAHDDLRDSDKLLVQKALNMSTGIGGDPGAIDDTATTLQKGFIAAQKTGDGVAAGQFVKQVQGLGGDAAVAALAAGTLTQEMLNKPQPKVTGGQVTSSSSSGGFDYASYKTAIGVRESSGNYGAENTIGYLGMYQMGAMALQDAGYVKSGVNSNKALNDPKNWLKGSKEEFLRNPAMQEDAMRKYTNKQIGYLKSKKVIDNQSSPEEVAGFLAAAHLVGAGGAAQLKAGNVKQDAYGSKSSEYYNIGVGSQTGGNFGPSGTGSASAGGSAVNSISASQAQSGNGVTVVDNSTTVTDNSTSASSSNSYTQQVSPRRTNNTGVRQDMVMP